MTTPPRWLRRELAERGRQRGRILESATKVRHRRREPRALWALADPDQHASVGSSGTRGTPWPHLRQICCLERHRLFVRRRQVIATEVEVRYSVTSLPPARPDAKALLALVRGHWGIETRLHSVRDVTFDEDRCQIRGGAIPETFAACRTLVIALLRRTGAANIAAALRTDAALLVLSAGTV